MAAIFISYRRDDSRGDTGRLYDRLKDNFSKEELFRDIDTIAPGEQFQDVLDDTLAKCDALLAVIGNKWLNARRGGKRRLENPQDYVRCEIVTALKRGVPIIPVLVGDASMPRQEDLPRDLASLAAIQAAVLHELHFDRDVELLVGRIAEIAADQLALGKLPRTIDRKRPWSYRDADRFSDFPERICPGIKVDWPSHMIPLVRGKKPDALAKDLEFLLDRMLQQLWRQQGVIVPGIVMCESRANNGEYVVLVSGTPVAHGSSSPPKGSPSPKATLEPAIEDLGKAIRDNLRYLVGHQEVSNLLAVHASDAQKKVMRASGAVTDLTIVCRALLGELVSLVPFNQILTAFCRLRLQRNLVELVEEIRCLDEVRPCLWGNSERTAFVSLSPDLELGITRSIDYNAGQPVLAVSPELAQRFLSSLETALRELRGDVALLTSNKSIRPFIRRLASMQYPHLAVLSRDEIPSKISGKIVATVR